MTKQIWLEKFFPSLWPQFKDTPQIKLEIEKNEKIRSEHGSIQTRDLSVCRSGRRSTDALQPRTWLSELALGKKFLLIQHFLYFFGVNALIKSMVAKIPPAILISKA